MNYLSRPWTSMCQKGEIVKDSPILIEHVVRSARVVKKLIYLFYLHLFLDDFVKTNFKF